MDDYKIIVEQEHHYLILMRIENIEARSFYEIEAAQQNWSVSQLVILTMP